MEKVSFEPVTDTRWMDQLQGIRNRSTPNTLVRLSDSKLFDEVIFGLCARYLISLRKVLTYVSVKP